uniref:Ovule protein n=1 Tax=Mesocestoides corti TaxID=53468 RepID=A0A5K3FXN8_MESCO
SLWRRKLPLRLKPRHRKNFQKRCADAINGNLSRQRDTKAQCMVPTNGNFCRRQSWEELSVLCVRPCHSPIISCIQTSCFSPLSPTTILGI